MAVEVQAENVLGQQRVESGRAKGSSSSPTKGLQIRAHSSCSPPSALLQRYKSRANSESSTRKSAEGEVRREAAGAFFNGLALAA